MSSDLFRKLVRFMLSGGVVLAAYYAPYYLLTQFCGVWYQISAVTGSILSSVVNFLLQKFWTFKNKSKASMHKQAMEFTLMSIGFAVANSGMLYLLVGKLHLHYLLAQMFVTAILAIVSFFLAEWIFRESRP